MADPVERPADQPECPSLRGDGLLPPELRAWMLLVAATGSVEQELRSVVKGNLDVSHDEFLVLCLLADQPSATLRMTRIAELLGRPKTRLTYQVACLQHAGLATRRASRCDRRGIEVSLTDKSRQLLDEASPALADAITQAVTCAVGPHHREALRGLLAGTPDSDAQPA
jgi:DNA-binding MarR family transcriptional regulator